jgi:hypothetical protein
MTNATVDQVIAAADGPTLKYKDGEKRIVVPEDTVVVTYLPENLSELKAGAIIFVPAASRQAQTSLKLTHPFSLPRKGCRVSLHSVLFEACSAFTHVAACTLARSPIRDPLIEGFRHVVSSMPAPIASGWRRRRVGLAPHWKAPPWHGAHPFQTLKH